jgi:hypothetical protein
VQNARQKAKKVLSLKNGKEITRTIDAGFLLVFKTYQPGSSSRVTVDATQKTVKRQVKVFKF